MSKASCQVFSKSDDDAYDYVTTVETSNIGAIPSAWSKVSLEKTVTVNFNNWNFSAARENLWKAYTSYDTYMSGTSIKLKCDAHAGAKLFNFIPVGMHVNFLPEIIVPLKDYDHSTHTSSSKQRKLFTSQSFSEWKDQLSKVKWENNKYSYPVQYSYNRMEGLPFLQSLNIDIPDTCYAFGESTTISEASWQVCLKGFNTDLKAADPTVHSEITLGCHSETNQEGCGQSAPAVKIVEMLKSNPDSLSFVAQSVHKDDRSQQTFFEYFLGEEYNLISYTHTVSQASSSASESKEARHNNVVPVADHSSALVSLRPSLLKPQDFTWPFNFTGGGNNFTWPNYDDYYYAYSDSSSQCFDLSASDVLPLNVYFTLCTDANGLQVSGNFIDVFQVSISSLFTIHFSHMGYTISMS